MPQKTFLEKDLKARIDQGEKITLSIQPTANLEYFVQEGKGKSASVLTTYLSRPPRVRMFKDITRLLFWADELGIHRMVLDVTFPLPKR